MPYGRAWMRLCLAHCGAGYTLPPWLRSESTGFRSETRVFLLALRLLFRGVSHLRRCGPPLWCSAGATTRNHFLPHGAGSRNKLPAAPCTDCTNSMNTTTGTAAAHDTGTAVAIYSCNTPLWCSAGANNLIFNLPHGAGRVEKTLPDLPCTPVSTGSTAGSCQLAADG